MFLRAATAAALLLTIPASAHAASPEPESFGLHVQSLGAGVGPRTSVSAIRLWDAGVRWDQIETKPGKYNWKPLDQAVAAAQRAGAEEILYVLGSTPKWAASKFSSVDLYGPGTSSLPKKNSYYVRYAKAVAKRYQGRITAYQIWNEANTRSFYNGGKYDGWVKLAGLTKQASKAIKKIDRKAAVVAASSTVIPTAAFQNESFFYRYLRELKRQKVRFDAVSVHLYPVNPKQGPDARVASIKAVRKVMARTGLAKKALWDTEVNYGDRRDPAKQVIPSAKKAAAYVSRTYLDSARLGIDRTFWYGWDINVLGISLSNPDGTPTSAGVAFQTTRDWMLAGKWRGCKGSKVVTCRVGSTRIVWAKKSKTIKRPGGVTQQCRLDGSCIPAAAKVRVTASPTRLS